MNLVNLFGNKNKAVEPEYFLAIEIHESLIKTALWEILEGQPEVVNVGSFESWTDEESLINGVDSSLDQAIKVIKNQPRRVIFGLPDSWMDEDKIHPTKIKLVTHICKELGLEPIGVVTTNRAVAHYLKKREGMPPTVILLEVYTSKVAVSYVYLGEVKKTEEVARSGDLAHDVEEGLARMDLSNYPARFILTNGGGLEEESQQITAFPWTDRLPFKHIPKVEVLPIDFSIKSIALTGGVEAVQFLGMEVAPEQEVEPITSDDANIMVPVEEPPSLGDLGFAYEETSAPTAVPVASITSENLSSVNYEEELPEDEPEFAFTEDSPIITSETPRRSNKIPKLPKLSLPSFSMPKFRPSGLVFLALPLLLVVGAVAYFVYGQAEITVYFNPQKLTRQIDVAIAESPQSGMPTLVATKKTFVGSAQESVPTTGTATVGDSATGTVTIFNRTAAPIVLKSGTTIGSENGKYNYLISDSVTIASKSADLVSGSEVFGKQSGVAVKATKIGAEYNLTKSSTFTVDSYSKTVAYAVAESDFTGGTSRTVNAVSKVDQDKVLGIATEKIKSQVKTDQETQTPGFQVLPLSEIKFDKKEFDHDLNDEATAVNLSLAGSLDALVYSDDSLFALVQSELQSQIPAGTYITSDSTSIRVDSPELVNGQYQAKLNVEVSLYPKIDEAKILGYIKGKPASKAKSLLQPIPGFKESTVKITPALPLITKFLPLNNIKFNLVGI